MSDVDLSDINITGADQHPPDASVKLNGPPGTGKTTEAAARLARLLEEHDYILSDVLWATYRHSLAMETLERLAAWDIIPHTELKDPKDGPTRYISTIHAVANRLVGGIGDIVNYGHRKKFAGARNLRYDKENAWDEPPGQLLFEVFDYAANNRLDLQNSADREQIPKIDDLNDKYPGSVARAFDDWQNFKTQRDIHDFWEQLKAPIESDVRPSQDIVVVDEYHDATPLMAQLAEEWIDAAEIAIVAGDPLQVVNNYAGADPEFFNRLDLPEVLLDTTHRVPEEHWAVATQILKNAHEPPSVERKKSGSFHVGESPRFDYSKNDGWAVPEEDSPRSPAALINSYGTDTMFLARTRRQASGVARALEKAGVLFETQKSMDLDGWGAKEDISERTALYNALQRLEDVEPSESTDWGLDEFVGDDKNPSDIRLEAREAAAILDHANHKYLSESRSDVTNAAEDITDGGDFVSGSDLNEFVTDQFWSVYSRGSGAVRHLNASSNTDEGERLSKRDRNAIRAALQRNDHPVIDVETKVYTIHASKGSEARNVVVYDGITSRIEKAMMSDESARQNEYRTWYVALTRADANTFVLKNGFEWTTPFLPDSLIDAAQEAHKKGVNA